MAALAKQLQARIDPPVSALEPKRCVATKINVDARSRVLAMVRNSPAMPLPEVKQERPAFIYADDGEEVLATLKPQRKPLPVLNQAENQELADLLAWAQKADAAIHARMARLNQFDLPRESAKLKQIRGLLGSVIAEGETTLQNAWYAKATAQ
ncbi:hypothetical protein [Iodobacter fluviatilis]|uniref:Uncharacterized protein n=1 Tax=Iodobacter fluviatilis TaxID=537 RepID=A0A377Q3I1_9NEIS|nr:hypothetical protein [Iodobacter fluviatilis]TCU90243.1 hypothetical protein EV682_101268 [Iodobacter fluviatilis]STQ89270.1 Uncharacterised protein [Iodobacter fluviatilis]